MTETLYTHILELLDAGTSPADVLARFPDRRTETQAAIDTIQTLRIAAQYVAPPVHVLQEALHVLPVHVSWRQRLALFATPLIGTVAAVLVLVIGVAFWQQRQTPQQVAVIPQNANASDQNSNTSSNINSAENTNSAIINDNRNVVPPVIDNTNSQTTPVDVASLAGLGTDFAAAVDTTSISDSSASDAGFDTLDAEMNQVLEL